MAEKNEEARRLLEENIVGMEVRVGKLTKEHGAARRRASRLGDEIEETRGALEGLHTALKALGGPLPKPEEPDQESEDAA